MDVNEALKCIMEIAPQLDDQQIEAISAILHQLSLQDAWECAREMGWL